MLVRYCRKYSLFASPNAAEPPRSDGLAAIAPTGFRDLLEPVQIICPWAHGEQFLVAWHDNGVAIADLQELWTFLCAIILEKKPISRGVLAIREHNALASNSEHPDGMDIFSVIRHVWRQLCMQPCVLKAATLRSNVSLHTGGKSVAVKSESKI